MNNNMFIDPEYILQHYNKDELYKLRKLKKVSKVNKKFFELLNDRLDVIKNHSNYYDILNEYKQEQKEEIREYLIYIILWNHTPFFWL